MANITVTYSFSNGTTADASQVNQNFTDIINGTSDGTKDFSISALTAAGNVSFTGSSITLGNASSDDLTITASLASTISIKTTASYNIGSSTLGLAGIYFGANSQTVRIVGSGSMSATWTLTLPVSAGTNNYALTTNGSGTTSWTAWSTSAWAATTSALGTVYLPNGEITVHTSNGYGSTDNKIRIFTTSGTATGSGISRATSASTGDTFTINEAGVYALSVTDCFTGQGDTGWSRNADATGRTTSILSLTFANGRIAHGYTAGSDLPGTVAVTVRASAAEVFRVHTDGTSDSGAPSRAMATVCQVFRTA